MKIVVFSPCASTSAIGRMCSLVVRELRKIVDEVAIVRSEDPDCFERPTHEFDACVVDWRDVGRVSALVEGADLIVYQIGDNFSYHRGCLEWLTKFPGIVLLHDNFLGHLFWSYADVIGRSEALEMLALLYGAGVRDSFFNHADSTSFIEFAASAAPMTEWVCGMATGVIVHSSGALDRITKSCVGPVEVVPLPYDAPAAGVIPDKVAQGCQDDRKNVVLTMGHVNPNKRHASVIEAIGSSANLKRKVKFVVVGAALAEERDRLQRLADQFGVQLEMTGEVDDRRLAELIHEADVMCCLRWPSLEAASASTIESMLYGKPIIVIDTGFYRDLPDECVIKISPEREIDGLLSALERLVSDPAEAARLGLAAQIHARSAFRADRYAERIVEMRAAIEQTKLLSRVADEIASTVERWGGRMEPSVVEHIAAPLGIFK